MIVLKGDNYHFAGAWIENETDVYCSGGCARAVIPVHVEGFTFSPKGAHFLELRIVRKTWWRSLLRWIRRRAGRLLDIRRER